MGKVTVIGAGIVGISCALYLQRAGHDVTVIDRQGPGEGCSYGNCGGIATTEFMPLSKPGNLMRVPGWLLDPLGPLSIKWSHLPGLLPYLLRLLQTGRPGKVREIVAAAVPLSHATWGDFNPLLKDAGLEDEIINDFCLTLYDSDADLRADQAKWDFCQEHGFGFEKLPGAGLRDLEPDLAPDFAWGFINTDWRNARDPHRLVVKLAEHMVGQGGRICRGEVAAIEAGDGQANALQLTGGERLEVESLVVAAGVWSKLLTRPFGLKVPLQSDRGYNTTIAEPGIAPKRQIVYPAQGLAITPMDGKLRLGGSVELANLDTAPNYKRTEAQVKRTQRVFPKLQMNGEIERWMGQRPSTPDSLPVIGRAPQLSNVYLAFGHGHLGLTWGPTTGRLIAALLSGQPTGIDMQPYRADRF